MRTRMFYKLLGSLIQVNVLKIRVPLIDIGSVSNLRKDFLEPDLIENISAESIAKTDLENYLGSQNRLAIRGGLPLCDTRIDF